MDDKKIAKYIERIEIKGLWGQFDVDWKLHEDVNILVGKNGTGKSSIVRLLSYAFHIPILARTIDFEEVKLTFFPNAERIIQYKDKASKEEKASSSAKIPMYEDGERIRKNILYWNNNTDKFGALNIDIVDTFDLILNEKNPTNIPIGHSLLDDKLDLLEHRFIRYQLRLTRRVEQMLYNDGNSSVEKRKKEDIFAKKRLFIKMINQLFEPTGKEIDEQTNEQITFITKTKKRLSKFDLSSGEKQLLIILLTVVTQDQAPSILIMDEPEVSLDTSWQSPLIKIIRELNPNCQVIVVTHSTSIFMDGHQEKLFWMDDKENGILEKTKHRQTTI